MVGKIIHITSTETLPGYEIEKVQGLVWGTTVRARFFGKDLIAIFKVLMGGEVQEYTNMVNEARGYVLQRVRQNAMRLGADAVVGLKMGSTAQIVPGTAEIFAYGTAVKLKPKKKSVLPKRKKKK